MLSIVSYWRNKSLILHSPRSGNVKILFMFIGEDLIVKRKPILIRSTPSPLDEFSIVDAWKYNLLHNNSGNVAFPYGLIRNLTTLDTDVISDWYGHHLPEPEVVNEEYAMYVLPMANDIGSHFVGEMRRLTSYIAKLTIPVVVVGIGGAFASDDQFDRPKSYDTVVKNFVDEVLKRSNTIGLRGRITGRYMESLGYVEGEHFTVIGDPTLYDRGRRLDIKPFSLNAESRIAYNMTPTAPVGALRFLNRIALQYENSHYIAQDLGDLTKMYAGVLDPTQSLQREGVDDYPNSLTDYQFASGKSSMFLTAPSWLKAMEEYDISIGTRIHGSILPTHAGLPTITLSFGSRLTELVEFHNLPHVPAESVDEKHDISDLLDRVDFNSPNSVQSSNFENYVRFLEHNDICHSYRESAAGEMLEFDRQLSNREVMDALRPLQCIESASDVIARISAGDSVIRPKVIAQKQRMVRLADEVKELRAKVRMLDPQVHEDKIALMHRVLDSLV